MQSTGLQRPVILPHDSCMLLAQMPRSLLHARTCADAPNSSSSLRVARSSHSRSAAWRSAAAARSVVSPSTVCSRRSAAAALERMSTTEHRAPSSRQLTACSRSVGRGVGHQGEEEADKNYEGRRVRTEGRHTDMLKVEDIIHSSPRILRCSR